MPLYNRASGLAQEKLNQALSRAKSKDQLPDHRQLQRERYLSKAGAQQILAGGRQERERLLMDRYRRSNDSEQQLPLYKQRESAQDRYEDKLARLRAI